MAFEENENIEQNNRLIELSDSDYEIVDGEPDIEGWDVKDNQGTVIGEVIDLLFDPESRKVRYMIVELDEDVEEEDENLVETEDNEELDTEVETDDDYETEEDETVEDEDRRVLIPIGLAELVPEDEDVILPGITLAQLSTLPLYEKGTLTPATESYIRSVFDTTHVVESNEAAGYFNRSDFYDHNHFNDDRFYNRQPETIQDEPAPTAHTDGPVVMQEEYLLEKETPANSEENLGGFENPNLTNEELDKDKPKSDF